MLETLQTQAAVLGPIEALVADTGYCSEKNVEACEALGITPFIAVAREDHHPDWRQRHTAPEELAEDATLMQAMIHRLKTQEGIGRRGECWQAYKVDPPVNMPEGCRDSRDELAPDYWSDSWRMDRGQSQHEKTRQVGTVWGPD